MPELPEVETIRRALSPILIGKTISSIDVLSPKQFIGNPQDCVGNTIANIHRKGKVFVMETKEGLYFSVHLKMSGQLLFNQESTRSTRIIFHFTDDSRLLFNDTRKFGWIKVDREPIVPKGHDVLSPEFTEAYFTEIVSKTRKPIKTLLMDQEKMAGVGNIYANDALYLAKIHPPRPAATLTPEEIKGLFSAILIVINEGVQKKGSSRENGIYRLPDGTKGMYQRFFKIYAQKGKLCTTCSTKIVRMVIGGRSTFYCPVCQK
jgi:formamidopyrimidine-DNA glycosylase